MALPPGPILLPDGKALLNDGRFVVNADECCCPDCDDSILIWRTDGYDLCPPDTYTKGDVLFDAIIPARYNERSRPLCAGFTHDPEAKSVEFHPVYRRIWTTEWTYPGEGTYTYDFTVTPNMPVHVGMRGVAPGDDWDDDPWTGNPCDAGGVDDGVAIWVDGTMRFQKEILHSAAVCDNNCVVTPAQKYYVTTVPADNDIRIQAVIVDTAYRQVLGGCSLVFWYAGATPPANWRADLDLCLKNH